MGVKSKQRVHDHGEVFTPSDLVLKMLSLLKKQLEPYDSRVLEPACGSGNFLVPILEHKLDSVTNSRNVKRDILDRYYLHALMSIYGIEILSDNVSDCRSNLYEVLEERFRGQFDSDWFDAAENVLRKNIVCGDALLMKSSDGQPIRFSEWKLHEDGSFSMRVFQLDDLVNAELFGPGSLLDRIPQEEVFLPVSEVKGLTLADIGHLL